MGLFHLHRDPLERLQNEEDHIISAVKGIAEHLRDCERHGIALKNLQQGNDALAMHLKHFYDALRENLTGSYNKIPSEVYIDGKREDPRELLAVVRRIALLSLYYKKHSIFEYGASRAVEQRIIQNAHHELLQSGSQITALLRKAVKAMESFPEGEELKIAATRRKRPREPRREQRGRRTRSPVSTYTASGIGNYNPLQLSAKRWVGAVICCTIVWVIWHIFHEDLLGWVPGSGPYLKTIDNTMNSIALVAAGLATYRWAGGAIGWIIKRILQSSKRTRKYTKLF